jgi:hypothetical protein
LLADLIEDTSVVEAVAGYRASTLAAAQATILLIALCMASTYLPESQFPAPTVANNQTRNLQH